MQPSDLSFRVNATISAQRVVSYLTGTANTVKLPASVAEAPVGITTDDVKDTTTAIPVSPNGTRTKLLFDDTVTSGAQVGFDASGRGIPYAAVTGTTWSVGELIGPDVAATGTIAEVLINIQSRNII